MVYGAVEWCVGGIVSNAELIVNPTSLIANCLQVILTVVFCFVCASDISMSLKNVARKYVLLSPFNGLPKISDFKLIEELLPATLNDGEILCKSVWHSVDPYMRGWASQMKPGDTMPGGQIARVVQSNNTVYPEGIDVVGNFGWRDLTILKPKHPGIETLYKMPDMKNLPASYALGSVGMPGNTAYFGFTRICEPKPGNNVVVSSAAGAVGSIVGQIAKIKGCTVYGFAGTEEKLKWMKEELGFDHVFNYKAGNITKTLREFAPKGIDCLFDNVGGSFTCDVMRSMNPFGRIAICGAIATYNNETKKFPMIPMDYHSLIYKQLRLEGFTVMRWNSEWLEGLHQLRDWIKEGKIKVQETRREGFVSMPQAFIELLEGKNIGKMVVKA